MMKSLSNFVFSSIAPRDIRHVAAPDFKHCDGACEDVYRQMATEFQTVPPLVLHHSQPRVMVGLWAVARQAYIADQAGRGLREAVGAAVSEINQCPYCVDVHVAMLRGLGNDGNALALEGRQPERLDEVTRTVVAWATATRSPETHILNHPPFPAETAPRIIGTALMFHYLNRMVHIFLPEAPLPIPASMGWLKRQAGAAFGKTVGRAVVTLAAGDAPFPLSEESAPALAEFAWSEADPKVAAAFALFAKVAEETGAETLDPQTRALVLDHLSGWRGERPVMDRGWVEDAVAPLAEDKRPQARLALLTALASYQVTDADIAAFRGVSPSDAALIGATSWASFQAMRRISQWLTAP